MAQEQLNRSIEQQIIRRLDSYSFDSTRAQRSKRKLEKFTYKKDSLGHLFESHKELREIIQDSGVSFLELAIGKYVTFGKYNGVPITWMIIDVDHSGKLFLLSYHVLSLKCYNVIDRHSQIGLFTNQWESSPLQQWLNSDKLRVKYSSTPPSKSHVWNEINPYSTEKGFLASGNFTEWERELLTSYQNKKELVSLLRMQEAQTYLMGRGYDLRSNPTEEAMKEADPTFDFISPNQSWCYFLQDPHPDSPHLVYIVNAEGKMTNGYSYDGSIGVRPVIALKSRIRLEGKGTLTNPFEVKE